MSSTSNLFDNYRRRFRLLLIGLAFVRLVMALIIDPAPQEAYYWNYSRHPALSYYDHPPLTAWLLRVSTLIFGDTAFALHLPAVVISLILTIVLFRFLSVLYDEKTAFWAVVLACSVLLFSIGSIITTPDTPLLLFWLLLIVCLYRAVREGGWGWWLSTGVVAGAAMISKYTAVFALAGAGLFLVVSRQRRKLIYSGGPLLAALTAFLVFLPVIIWNSRHGWASFLFQTGRRAAEYSGVRLDYFAGFLGVQFVVGGLLILPFLVYAVFAAALKPKDEKELLFVCFAVPMIVVFAAVSPFHYVKMNWLAPAYLSAVSLLAVRLPELRRRFFAVAFRISLALAIVFAILTHILVALPIVGMGSADLISGWDELAAKVDLIRREMADSGPLFICGYDYKTASQLAFHLPDKPEVRANNIFGENGLAYNYWANPADLVGMNCLLVIDSRSGYRNARPAAAFFENISSEERLTVKRSGKKITEFAIYRCYRYKGDLR